MIRLHYSDGFLITSEQIAEAVMQYARALAERNTSDLVTVPIVDESSAAAESTMLLGPASQLYTSPTSEPFTAIDGDEFIEMLRAKTLRVLSDPSASALQSGDEPPYGIDDWAQVGPPTG